MGIFAKTIIVIVLVLIALAFIFCWWNFFRMEHTYWTETVQCRDNSTLRIEYKKSARAYMRFGHMVIGGGDHHYEINVHAGAVTYVWSGGDEIPIAFGFSDGKLYMAVFDRQDMARVRFRYYRSSADHVLTEIQPPDFPRELAVQNTWLNDEDAALIKEMDPEKLWFRESLTARMWLHLEKGVEYYEIERPTPDFISDYKKKYLEPPPGVGAATKPTTLPA